MPTPIHRAAGSLRRVALTAGALVIVGGASLAAAPTTSAADVERHASGACSKNSTWELDLEREHGRIEIDLDVDTPRSGKTWRVKMWHDGTRFVNVTRVTDGDGELEVDRNRDNHPGKDRIRFKAVNLRNGEVCKGSLKI